MIRVFIGFDQNETVAFHVLSHSIMRHSSVPVSITPLVLAQLPLTRPRDPTQSTDFAFSRFLVPWLCNYEGQAIFMDSDMLCRADIAELAQFHDGSVSVVKHDYMPKPGNKFLGQVQTSYAKKNWSSLMVFNNERCRILTPKLVDSAAGLFLHQFQWCEESEVGELPAEVNHLVGEYPPNPDAKIVHFTNGMPGYAKYSRCEFAYEWYAEKSLMLHYNNIGEYKKQANA